MPPIVSVPEAAFAVLGRPVSSATRPPPNDAVTVVWEITVKKSLREDDASDDDDDAPTTPSSEDDDDDDDNDNDEKDDDGDVRVRPNASLVWSCRICCTSNSTNVNWRIFMVHYIIIICHQSW